jgi:hypothetical protein
MNIKKKKLDEEDFEEEYMDEDFEDEDEDFEDTDDEIFTCRVCGNEFTYQDGDDYLLLCDSCAENYNMDQIWTDFDTGKLKEEDLKTVDLDQYKYKE